MLIALHKQARTTPHVRAQIAASGEAKGVELSDLVNELLKREIEIIEALR